MNQFIWIKFNFLEKWFSSPDGLRLESVCSSSVFITLSLNERFLHPINFLVSYQNSLNCKFHLKHRLINYPIQKHCCIINELACIAFWAQMHFYFYSIHEIFSIFIFIASKEREKTSYFRCNLWKKKLNKIHFNKLFEDIWEFPDYVL